MCPQWVIVLLQAPLSKFGHAPTSHPIDASESLSGVTLQV